MTELFTDAWARAWGEALNKNDDFRRAAQQWSDTIVMQALADPALGLPETAAVYLHLEGGICRVARLATADDVASATYVISGKLAAWLTVLDGQMAPTMAILLGKLSLLRGSLGGLLPHVSAASALVRVAQSVRQQAASKRETT